MSKTKSDEDYYPSKANLIVSGTPMQLRNVNKSNSSNMDTNENPRDKNYVSKEVFLLVRPAYSSTT